MEIHPDLAQDAIFHIHRVRRQRGHQVMFQQSVLIPVWRELWSRPILEEQVDIYLDQDSEFHQ